MALSATPDFWWKLDETSGTAVANSGSYGTPSDYDGNVLQQSGGSYSWLGSGESWGSGGITGGIDLAAAGQHDGWYIKTANPVPLDNATKITIAFWVELGSGLETGSTMFDTSVHTLDQYVQLRASHWSTTWHRVETAYSSDTTDRQTHGGDMPSRCHVTIVLDFTLGSNGLKHYINGVLAYQNSLSGSKLVVAGSLHGTFNPQTYIGASVNTGGASASYVWDGALCDMRLWLDAATSDEVEDIYNNTLGGGGAIATLTGQAITSALGTLSATGAALHTLTGQAITANLGTLTVSGAVSVTLSGLEISSALGTLSAAAGATVTLSGLSATASLGDLSATGGAAVTLSGLQIDAAHGTITGTGGAVVTLIGAELTAMLGTLEALSNASGELTATITLSPALDTTVTVHTALDGDSTIAPALSATDIKLH